MIQTSGVTAAVRAAKGATTVLPIVFGSGDDPVAAGLVASLARPGSNVTGVSFLAVALNPKRLELLRELVPQAGALAMLVNPENPATERVIPEIQEAARLNNVRLIVVKASSESEIDAAFATVVQQHVGGLLVSADSFLNSRRDRIMSLAERYSVPAIYEFREFATAGGLISYGPSVTAAYVQVGIHVGKILRGAKVADLPVMQPAAFELVVNLKTAKALGLTIPPSIRARADEAIE